LLSVVVAVAFFAGISYSFVAIPAQTQLQEDLPPDVRGRVFGVLNMLVSVASFLPILVVGPIADIIGTTVVLVLVAISISVSGVASILIRGPLKAVETLSRADVGQRDPFVAALRPELRNRPRDDDDDADEVEAADDGREAREAREEVLPNPASGAAITGGSDPTDLIDTTGEATARPRNDESEDRG
jgi:MFS family permease